MCPIFSQFFPNIKQKVGRGGLPINWTHNGAIVMIPKQKSPIELCQLLTEDSKGWSQFLLRELEIGVKPKIFVKNDEIFKPL